MEDSEEIMRQMIRHENELMNHRMTWLLTAEGLFFAALAFMWKEPDTRYLVYIICAVGGIVAASAFVILREASLAIERLYKLWCDKFKKSESDIGVTGRWHTPRLLVPLLPWNFVPPAF